MFKNKTAIQLGVVICFALALLTFFLGLASRYFWFFDVISHFRLYHLLAFVLVAIVAGLCREKYISIASIALALMILLPLIKYYLPQDKCTGNSQIDLISINLQSENDDYSAVKDFIAVENPKLLLTTELTSDWLSNLEESLAIYPHRIYRTREDHFGIGLFSKLPFETAEIEIFDHLGVPAIRVDVLNESTPITIIGIHPIPPFWPLRHKLRDGQLMSAVQLAQSTPSVDVVMGDFNSTSFSAGYRRALRDAGLKDSRLGFGWQHSWHSRLPGIHLAIDHAWVSKELCVVERKLGPDVGSDHLPVVLRLAVGK